MSLRHRAVLVVAIALAAGLWGARTQPVQACKVRRHFERHPENPIVSIPNVLHPFVLAEPGRYRLWAGDGRAIVILESADAVRWKKAKTPALPPGARGRWDDDAVSAPCVVEDRALAPGHARRHRLYYTGRAGERFGIGLAFSKDGKRFQRHQAQSGLVLAPAEPEAAVSDPHVVHHDGLWHLWYGSTGADGGMAIAHATSTDGIEWTRRGRVIEGASAWERQQQPARVGRPSVVYAQGRFEMFYDADLDTSAGTASGVGFAWSADGQEWEREPGVVFSGDFSPPEPQGILTGTAIAVDGGRYLLYYAAAGRPGLHLARSFPYAFEAEVR
jgi:sucrose-6-phosphate hydrolase SacC (GH32 family)